MDQQGLLGRNIIVIGTNALFAYEAAAGLFFDRALTATRDMDLLWDVRPKLTLFVEKDTDHSGFMGILRKVDRSFEPVLPGGFKAVNKNGYIVDLVKPEPKIIMKKEQNRMGDSSDLKAAEIPNLHWLLSSPKFSQTVIGDDGYPAIMTVPDPRAFAIHKIWLNGQHSRDPLKKKRDSEQGIAVVSLVLQHLQNLKFSESVLKMFPQKVVKQALDKITNEKLPAGFDLDND